MRARLNGPFRVWDNDGQDITPVGMKERGLLALLLASPGQRRTRIWLQSMLWSERPPQQASGSLRQALSNVRKTLGDSADRLQSDRTTVWIAPEAALDMLAAGEFLADLDIRDPAFTDWLRDQSGQWERDGLPDQAAVRVFDTVRGPRQVRPVVVLRRTDLSVSARGRFLIHAIAQRIAGDLILSGDIDVIESDAHSDPPDTETMSAVVEMEGFSDADQENLLLRVIGMPARRIVWTGRLSLSLSFPGVWESADVSRCVNKAVVAVADILMGGAEKGQLASLSRATRLIYSFDHPGLMRADNMLMLVQDGEMRGLALAWRGFIRLTSALEYRDCGPDSVAEARAFADDALRAMSDHPVVLALASRIRLKLEGDLDQAHYLALRAAEMSDQNPYALEALGQSLVFHGDFRAADEFAQRARTAAQGLPHSFNWDMQACLTSLGLGQMAAAREAAAECHRKMPFYRPALRYLVALSLLMDDRVTADYYIGRLRRLEPDFIATMLVQPDYPVETLRALGHIETLRARLS